MYAKVRGICEAGSEGDDMTPEQLISFGKQFIVIGMVLVVVGMTLIFSCK